MSSGEFRDYLALYERLRSSSWAGWPMPSGIGTIRTRWSPTSSTGTSTTPTSASPTASSARSIAGPSTTEGYVLRSRRSAQKIDECKAIGGVQILLQGGHNPYIPFEWYLELMRLHQAHHPIHIHGFSPSEVVFFSERFGLPRHEVIRELQRRGARQHPRRRRGNPGRRDAPAGGRKKAQTEEWLGVQEEAHRQGMKTSVTMMYGLGETNADRIEHLFRVREVQRRDRRIHRVHLLAASARGDRDGGAAQDRRGHLSAHPRMARIILDNVPNLQSSWVTWGSRPGRWRSDSAPTISAA